MRPRQQWQTAFDRLAADLDAGYDTGRVMLFSGGPLHNQTIAVEPGPLPPMYGRVWHRNRPDEIQLWYALVRDSGNTAVYNWCDWAEAITAAMAVPRPA